MATTFRLHSLNQYPQLKTDAGIDGIIDFINSNYTQFPNNLNQARQRTRYMEKFGQNSGFRVENNNVLVYHPNNNQPARLIVSRVADQQQNLQQIYDDTEKGLGLGLNAFYSQVARNFLNIKKQLSSQFLKRQGNYQIMKIPKKAINKPVVARAPNERWQVDCIQMAPGYPSGLNGGYEHILTVVDVFSGKVWARGLQNKSNNAQHPTMRNAIRDICQEAHTEPHILQCDNGKEFLGQNPGGFSHWCVTNNITIARAKSYSPQGNGKVERMNQTIRRKVKAGCVKNNNLVWQPLLQQYINNINNQKHSKTKLVPNDIWRQGYVRHNPNIPVPNPLPITTLRTDNGTLAQLQDYARRKIENKAIRIVAESDRRAKVFHVNDYVRINLLALSSASREQQKSSINGLKLHAIRYTPEVFRVTQVVPRTALEQRGYFLVKPGVVGAQNQGGVEIPMLTRANGNRRQKFYASQLVKVDFAGDRGPPLPQNNVNVNNANYLGNVVHSTLDPNTRFRAYYLNRVRTNWNPLNVTD